MGGTIGYAVTVVVTGYFLKDNYSSIFWMAALLIGIGLFFVFLLPPVKGAGDKKKKMDSVFTILSDHKLAVLIGFNLVYGLGNSFFYNFYPLHFVEIGGNSQMIGWMMFACSVAEIPCLLVMHRLVKRFGVAKILILAGTLTCIRWTFLCCLTDPLWIIIVNLLHGFSFTGFTYCLLNYINYKVPASLRAGSQVLQVTITTVFSKLLFGFIGGIAFEEWGSGTMMACSAVLIGVATVLFAIWSRGKKEDLAF